MFDFKSAHSENFTVSLQIEQLYVFLRTMQVPWQRCSNDAFPLSLLLLNLKMGVRHKGFAGNSRTPWVQFLVNMYSLLYGDHETVIFV